MVTHSLQKYKRHLFTTLTEALFTAAKLGMSNLDTHHQVVGLKHGTYTQQNCIQLQNGVGEMDRLLSEISRGKIKVHDRHKQNSIVIPNPLYNGSTVTKVLKKNPPQPLHLAGGLRSAASSVHQAICTSPVNVASGHCLAQFRGQPTQVNIYSSLPSFLLLLCLGCPIIGFICLD